MTNIAQISAREQLNSGRNEDKQCTILIMLSLNKLRVIEAVFQVHT